MKPQINKWTNLTVCAGLFAFTTSVGLCAQVQIYGIIDSSLVYQHKNRDVETHPKITDSNGFEQRTGVFRGSRWGVKGSENLGNGYSVSFVLENGFETDTGKNTLNRFFGREAQVTFSGPFGDFAMGRLGMLMSGCGTYTLTNWFSPFGTTWGNFSVASNNYQVGHQRLDNAIVYRTPAYAGLQMTLQYSLDMDSSSDNDLYTTGSQHGTEGKSNVDRYYALGLSYKNYGWDVAFTADSYNYAHVPGKKAHDDAYTLSLGGSYKFSNLKLYASGQYFRNASTKFMRSYNQVWSNQSYEDGFNLITGVEVPLPVGNLFAAVGLVESKASDSGDDSESSRRGASLGYNYYFSKTTLIYTMINYARDERDLDKQVNGQRVKGNDKADTIEIGLGLTHWF